MRILNAEWNGQAVAKTTRMFLGCGVAAIAIGGGLEVGQNASALHSYRATYESEGDCLEMTGFHELHGAQVRVNYGDDGKPELSVTPRVSRQEPGVPAHISFSVIRHAFRATELSPTPGSTQDYLAAQCGSMAMIGADQGADPALIALPAGR